MRFLASLRYDSGGRHLGLRPIGNNDIPASLEMHFERLYAVDSSSPPSKFILFAAFAFIFRCPPLPPGISSFQSRHRRNRTVRSVRKPALHRVVASMKPRISPSTRSRIASTSINSSCLPSGRVTRRQSSSRRQSSCCSRSTHHPILSPLQQQHQHLRLSIRSHQLPRRGQDLVDPGECRGLDHSIPPTPRKVPIVNSCRRNRSISACRAPTSPAPARAAVASSSMPHSRSGHHLPIIVLPAATMGQPGGHRSPLPAVEAFSLKNIMDTNTISSHRSVMAG